VYLLIENKTTALIVAILTFILGSVLLVGIIFYILGYPLSSIPEHQLYVAFGILASAAVASVVYGRGSNERASKASQCVDELLGITVDKKTMWKILRAVEQMPTFVINDYVSKKINAVEAYDDGIKEYKSQLTDEDLSKIRKLVETPIPELQNVMNELYLKTNLEQFKILADPSAEPLITINLVELKKVLFNE
jgi:hypothetical protein